MKKSYNEPEPEYLKPKYECMGCGRKGYIDELKNKNRCPVCNPKKTTILYWEMWKLGLKNLRQ